MLEKKKLTKAIIILIILSFALGAGAILVRKSQEVRKGAFYGGVSAGLWPNEKEVAAGEEFNLYLKINPVSGEEKYLVTGVDLRLKSDPELLDLVKAEFQSPYTGTSFKDEETGEIKMVAVTTASRDEIPQKAFDLVKLTFRAKTNGEINLDRTGDYQIVGSRGQAGDIDRTLELTSFTGAKITISGEVPEGGWPTLKFKIKFGGTEYEVSGEKVAVEDIPPQKVKVAVRKEEFSQTYDDITVTCDQEAVCQGELELTGVNPGDNYAILIKGPVHLAKRFCRDQQEEYCWWGEESISLKSGENQFDWTKTPLEPGDVNQDRRVDSLDFTQVKAALGTKGEDVPEDVNFNGEVNSQDLVFVLSTLSSKYEDDL